MFKLDIDHLFEGFPLIYVANIENNQPHVRVMSLIFHKGNLWICSPKSRPKVTQLQRNNHIEFCLINQEGDEFHNLRGSGTVTEIISKKIRKELAHVIPFFSEYWFDHNDPGFVLFRLDIHKYEYHPPGGKVYYVIHPNHPRHNQVEQFSKHFRRNKKDNDSKEIHLQRK